MKLCILQGVLSSASEDNIPSSNLRKYLTSPISLVGSCTSSSYKKDQDQVMSEEVHPEEQMQHVESIAAHPQIIGPVAKLPFEPPQCHLLLNSVNDSSERSSSFMTFLQNYSCATSCDR